jgi:hypothetical protein
MGKISINSLSKSRFFTRFFAMLNSNITFVSLLFICPLLGFLATIFHSGVLSFLSFVIIFIFLVFSDHSKNLLMICFASSSGAVPYISSIKIGGPLSYLVIVYIMIVFIDSWKNKACLDSRLVVPLLLFIVFFLFSFSVTIIRHSTLSIPSALSFYIYLLLPLFARIDNSDKKTFKNVLRFYLLGWAVFSINGLLVFTSSFMKTQIYGDPNISLFGSRFKGLADDQNGLSFSLLISSCFFVLFANDFKDKYFLWPLVAFLFFIGFATKSKSFIICFSILFCFYVLKFILKKPSISLIILAIILLTGSVFLLAGGSALIYKTLGRFVMSSTASESLIDQITTSRFSKWVSYMDYLYENPIFLVFGQGIRSSYYNQLAGIDVMHNFYINQIWDFGVIGTVLFFFYLFILSGFKWEKKKPVMYNLSILLPMILFLIYGSGLTLTGSADVIIHYVVFILLVSEKTLSENVVSNAKDINILNLFSFKRSGGDNDVASI